MSDLQKTSASKPFAIIRIVAGLPLVIFGAMHLVGAMPMKPLVEAAGMPAPGLMAVIGPLGQLIGGLLLVGGVFARVGGVIAIGTMLGAVYTHIQIPNDAWPDPANPGQTMQEPVPLMVVAIVIIILSAMIIWKGAGAWSFDLKAAKPSTPSQPSPPPTGQS